MPEVAEDGEDRFVLKQLTAQVLHHLPPTDSSDRRPNPPNPPRPIRPIRPTRFPISAKTRLTLTQR